MLQAACVGWICASATVWGENTTDGFVAIPAGTYQRGDAFDETDLASSRPVHEIEINSFYIAEAPVTYSEWRAVHNWAVENGYEFDNPGSRGWSASSWAPLSSGSSNNRHPVVEVNWYDVVKWCNARSEKEELTPVYFTDEELTSVYRTGRIALTAEQVDWSADGYRLPTEAEWEKAARGGLVGKRWPWGNGDIDPGRANYDGNAGGTTAVRNFPPNDYGLYDMAGNVQEWCWDWHDSDWYGKPGANTPDSRGPPEGDRRVLRGGSWRFAAENSRVARRTRAGPGGSSEIWGFRVVANFVDPPHQTRWSDKTLDLGNGWRWLPWLGVFTPFDYLGEADRHWLFHEDHRWWFVDMDGDASRFHVYDRALSRWFWIDRAHYPWMYDYHLSAWTYYAEGSRDPRWFFNLLLSPPDWQFEEEYEEGN